MKIRELIKELMYCNSLEDEVVIANVEESKAWKNIGKVTAVTGCGKTCGSVILRLSTKTGGIKE